MRVKGKEKKVGTDRFRSGRYKALIITAVSLSSFSYLLLMLRWHGNTNFWESLYIFPRFVPSSHVPFPPLRVASSFHTHSNPFQPFA